MGASYGKKKAYNLEQQSAKSGRRMNGVGKSALVFQSSRTMLAPRSATHWCRSTTMHRYHGLAITDLAS
ncbi:hypothetical protein SRHO_G00269120 [Serrasalmus rhombeus]